MHASNQAKSLSTYIAGLGHIGVNVHEGIRHSHKRNIDSLVKPFLIRKIALLRTDEGHAKECR